MGWCARLMNKTHDQYVAEAAKWIWEERNRGAQVWNWPVLTAHNPAENQPGFPDNVAYNVFTTLEKKGLIAPTTGPGGEALFKLDLSDESRWRKVMRPPGRIGRFLHRFTGNEWTTLIVSVLALLISAGSLYYQHFFERHSLLMSVLGTDWTHSGDGGSWASALVEVEFAVVNRGTSDAILQELEVSWVRNERGTDMFCVDQGFLVENVPLLLRPGDVKILKACGKVTNVDSLYRHWSIAEEPATTFTTLDSLRVASVALHATSVDGRGRTHEWYDVVARCLITRLRVGNTITGARYNQDPSFAGWRRTRPVGFDLMQDYEREHGRPLSLTQSTPPKTP